MDLIKFLENSSYEEFKEWIKDRTINKSFKYDDDSLIKIITVNKSKNNEKNCYDGTVLLKNSDGYKYVYNILSEDVVDLCSDSRYTLKSHHTIIKLYIKHSTPAIKLFTDDIITLDQAKSQLEEKNIEILNRTIMQMKLKKEAEENSKETKSDA